MAAETVKARPAAFIFIFITVMLDMLGIGIIIPVLPKLIEHFMDGNTARAAEMVGIFGSAWAVMQFVFSPVLGSLSDRFGRRPIVLLSNLGMGLDYILMALAPALSWLFVGRLISGITAASVATAGAYIADVSPPEQRARKFGMLGAAFGIGFILGPAVGGVLGSYNVHYPFWAAAGFSLLNFAYGYFILPESLKLENRSAFSWSKANPFGSVKLLATQRELWGLGLVTFLSQLAHTSLPSIYVLYAGYRYGWGPGQVGILLAGVGVASMIVQGGLVQPIVKQIGERPALLIGLLCASIGMTWYGIAWEGSLVWLGIPFAAFWGLFNATSQSVMSQRVSASEQGQLQGANSSVMAFAGILGPALFASVFAMSIDPARNINLPGLGFWLAGFCLLLAFLLASVLTRRSVGQHNPAVGEV
jgi:MFS transporter, DHA1 family, tetracycline resistance protein